jgi:hypothetical protein
VAIAVAYAVRLRARYHFARLTARDVFCCLGSTIPVDVAGAARLHNIPVRERSLGRVKRGMISEREIILNSMRTKEGIGVGSPRSGFVAAFGSPQKTEFEGSLYENYLKPRLGRLPPPGSKYSDYYNDYYYTRGIAFISRRTMLFTGREEQAVDPEPLVGWITVEQPK